MLYRYREHSIYFISYCSKKGHHALLFLTKTLVIYYTGVKCVDFNTVG